MQRRIGERTLTERAGEDPAQRLIEAVRNEPRQTFESVRRDKTAAQAGTNWSETAPQAKEIFRDVTQELRTGHLDQLEPVVGPDEFSLLKTANENYGQATRLGNIAGDKASREAGKSPVGVKEAGFGAAVAGAAGGGPVGGLLGMGAAGLAGSVGRRGQASLAAGANLLRKGIPGTVAAGMKPLEYEATKRVLRRPKDEADEEAIGAFLGSGM